MAISLHYYSIWINQIQRRFQEVWPPIFTACMVELCQFPHWKSMLTLLRAVQLL